MTESASIAQANADIMAFNDGAGALFLTSCTFLRK